MRRGYGIRYRYGMFKQAVKDGLQVGHSGSVWGLCAPAFSRRTSCPPPCCPCHPLPPSAPGGAARLLAGQRQPLGNPPPRDPLPVREAAAGAHHAPAGSTSCRAGPTSCVDFTPLRSCRRRLAIALLTSGLSAYNVAPQGGLLRQPGGRQVGAGRGGDCRGVRCAHPRVRRAREEHGVGRCEGARVASCGCCPEAAGRGHGVG